MNGKTAFLAGALSLLIAGAAMATSFIVPTDEQMVLKSHAVVVGTVESSFVRHGGPDGAARIETVYEVRVERTLKGVIGPRQTVEVVSPGGELDGFGVYVPGAPRMAEGQRVLLFLTRQKGHWETTDLMLGKFRFAYSNAGHSLLLRDTDDPEVESWPADAAGNGPARSEEGFLRFIDAVAHGRKGETNYLVAKPDLPPALSEPSSRRFLPSLMGASYSAASYTQVGTGPGGVRWPTVDIAAGLNFRRHTGCTGCDPTGADSLINNGMASWNNDCPSAINLLNAGTTTSAAGATNANCGNVCDLLNVIEFGDPNSTVLGTWAGSGTIAITTIVFTTAPDSAGTGFRQIFDADIVFQNGYLPSEPSAPTAATHELGHAIGWRHSNAAPSTPNDSVVSCNSLNEDCTPGNTAIMFWTVGGFGYTLQAWDQSAAALVYPGGSCAIARPQDYNGDQRSDLLLRNQSNGDIAQWQMNGFTLSAGAVIAAPGTSWVPVVSGDFNGDNKSDLMLQNSVSGEVAVWLMNGFTVTSGAIVSSPGTNWKPVVTGDFNGDGRSDVILQNSATGDIAEWQMNGFAVSGALISSPGTAWQVIRAGDFNGNGRDDLVLQNSGSGEIAEWLMNGFTISGGAVISAPGLSWKVKAVGEFNGDTFADIVLRNQTTGDVAEWQMNGFTITSGAVISSPGTSFDVMGTGDFNNNFRSDIILQNTAGDVAEWQMNGFAITGALVGSPGASYKVIVK
jgi:hypothetical protein